MGPVPTVSDCAIFLLILVSGIASIVVLVVYAPLALAMFAVYGICIWVLDRAGILVWIAQSMEHARHRKHP